VCIGTDVITGFPGESKEEFERSVDFVERAGFAYLHVFPYSHRSSTSAAKRWPELPRETVHERARRLQAVGRKLRRRYEDRFVGERASVLFEGARDPATQMLKGYSNNYLHVLCSGSDAYMNRLVDVRLVGRRGKYLEAQPA
jgi:threonylcarbamoyladenosine tRNA methylthiotransferase MtaB